MLEHEILSLPLSPSDQTPKILFSRTNNDVSFQVIPSLIYSPFIIHSYVPPENHELYIKSPRRERNTWLCFPLIFLSVSNIRKCSMCFFLCFSFFLYVFFACVLHLMHIESDACGDCANSMGSALPVQRVWAALYQLYKWKASTILQPLHVRPRTGGIWKGGYHLDFYWFWYGLAVHDRAHREGKASGRPSITLLCRLDFQKHVWGWPTAHHR